MTYQLNLKQFSGPLDKLLELIEARQLEITEISLAKVTDDFLRYLEGLTEASKLQPAAGKPQTNAENIRILADFIAVASRLLLIKSKSLLPEFAPTAEEEAEIKDLETRLKIYKEFKPARRALEALWAGGSKEFSRPYFLNLSSGGSSAGSSVGVFYPGSRLDSSSLVSALKNLFESFQKFILENQVIKDTIISLEAKINEIIEKFKKITSVNFKNLTHAVPRSEVVVTFLALLHLAREQIVSLEQKSHLSDIMIKSYRKPSA
jgi:segregation and condensation protein A